MYLPILPLSIDLQTLFVNLKIAGMKQLIFSICFVFYVIPTLVSQCVYQAYDGFDYTSGQAMHGLSGGSGWDGPWIVQDESLVVPGYQSESSSLSYSNLVTLGGSASGGDVYKPMGRLLDTRDDGPFADYIAAGSDLVGSNRGDTLWTSFVLQKEMDNDQSTYISLHNSNVPWCRDFCATQKIAVGYFGTDSNSGGNRYWTIKVGDATFVQSTNPVAIGSPTLFVVGIYFDNADTEVNVYINPTNLGTTTPPMTPSISTTTGEETMIRSMAVFLGPAHSNGSIDEIRMDEDYQCVVPDPSVPINFPPVASFSMTPPIGMAPLTVTFDASASSDPEGQPLTYLWDFGNNDTDTSPSPADRTFDILGEITISLTVTDDIGQQHTTYRTLSLTDENNTFPCYTTVSCNQMASCTADDGIISISGSNISHILADASGTTLTPTNEFTYEGLAPGPYSLYVEGNSSICTDTFELYVRRDSTTCSGWTAPACAMEIGMNLTGFADWNVERPLRNHMKHIRGNFVTYTDDCDCWNIEVGDELTLDADGYPTHLPQTTSAGDSTRIRYVLSSEGGNLQVDSTYVFLYDGEGVFDFSAVSEVISEEPNRVVFRPEFADNIIINFLSSSASNPIRNIRLLKLHDEFADIDSQPFYPRFLEIIEPFSVLRFMDWGHTNNSPLVQWSQRATPGYFTYGTTAGAPYEIMIDLCNQTQKDVWICVPHMADDDYITQMATLFRDSLDEDIVIYLEYSNEVWNWIFQQAHYNDQNKPSNLSYGRAMAEKAKNVFDIWHAVFGDDRCRVKRVLGLQGGFNGLNQEILSQLDQDDWDYGSPTHYFGLEHDENGSPVLDSNSTVQDVMLNAQNHFEEFSQYVKQDYRNVQIYGKEVITYEGGQHFVGNVFGIPYDYQQAMWDAQNSQEMYDMYIAVHDSIRNWGCKVAGNFSLASRQESVYGSWGVVPDIDVAPPYLTTATKYQVLLDIALDADCLHRTSWMGTQSDMWSTPCNWSRGYVPTAKSNVYIPAGTPFDPKVDEDGTIRSLSMEQQAFLEVLMDFHLTVLAH